uniref:Secreted protein n=1 Tax=Loa loa TaxID=7209 RepID=A0A1I7W3I1_LOALO
MCISVLVPVPVPVCVPVLAFVRSLAHQLPATLHSTSIHSTIQSETRDQKSPNAGIYRVAVWLAGCQHIGQRLSSLPSWFS